jgi:hypothetical protein
LTRILLRAIAVAIAAAGLIDPAITLSGSTRARLAIVQLDQAGPKGPALRTGGNRLQAARDRLVRDLGSSFEIVPQITSDAAAAILIGDRYPREAVPDALRVATVTTTSSSNGMRIIRIDAPRDVPPGTAMHVDVEAEGIGLAGRTSDLRLTIAGIEMERASHAWTAARERWRASFDAVPVGDPPFVVRIEAFSAAVAQAFRPASAMAAIVVNARRRPLRVEFYEPRPSWASTFVRRALEADPRFQVASVSVTSRGIASRTNDAVPLAEARLDDVDVVVAGGLDRLTAADARALGRFMRERGGAVVLLPDARLDAGPARDLIPVELKERLLERQTKLATTAPSPGFEASELLVANPRYAGRVQTNVGRVLSDPADQAGPKGPAPRVAADQAGPKGPALQIIAGTTGDDAAPVVVSVPRGDGRLVWSGAMDAWRFRANDDGAFDRFWQSTIAGLALAAPPPVDVRVEPSLLAPGEAGDVIVRVRGRDNAAVSATIDGGPIRLRPDPESGVFRGGFVARGTPGRSRVDVHVDGAHAQSASAAIVVETDARRVDPESPAPLSMLATSHGGIDVTPDRLDAIEKWARATVAAPTTTVRRHPMRSAWWMIPLTACLSTEWWIRRRRGER